jgi:hypothetical protein
MISATAARMACLPAVGMNAERAPTILGLLAAFSMLVVPMFRSQPGPAEQNRTPHSRARYEATLARIDALLALIDAKLAMVDAPRGCPSERDLADARQRLEELRRQQAEMQRRIDEARRENTVTCRLRRPVRIVKIDPACIDNPLAKGCM